MVVIVVLWMEQAVVRLVVFHYLSGGPGARWSVKVMRK